MRGINLDILLPTYNSTKYLKECLKSIKNQTYKNFRLLIIDGGSKDNTLDVIKSSGIRYKIISKKDKSFNDGVNKNINKIKSDYFTILSSDDVIKDKNYFKNLLSEIKKKELDIVFPDYGEIINNKFIYKKQPKNFSKIDYNVIVPGLGWIAKKNLSKKFYLPTKLIASSDYYLLLKFFVQNKKFGRLNGPCYYMRIGANSYINAFDSFNERRKIALKFGGNILKVYSHFFLVCLKFIIKFKIFSAFNPNYKIKEYFNEK